MGESIRRIEFNRARAGDPSLFERSWLPAAPRRALVLVHGLGEHSGRYEEFGAWLATQGCAVQSYDHRGHGRSGGHRNHVDRFSDFLDDLQTVLESVRERHPGLPLHLLGHSMGGLISAAFLADRQPAVTSAVLSAPPLEPPPGQRGRLWLGRLLRPLRPRHPIPTPVVPEALATDPAVGEAYLADPYVQHETMTVSLALALLQGMALARPEAIAVPALVLHGSDDPICAPDASAAFTQGLPRGQHVRYPGLRHEILNEPSRREIYAEILAWLEQAEASER